MKEDFVSFEIAKLLKEKGFNETCKAEWLEYIDGPSKGKTYLTECGSGLQHDSCSNSSLEKFNYDGQMYYAAPTLQMAMKWLREVHKKHIQVGYDIQLSWYYDIIDLKETVSYDYEEMKCWYNEHNLNNYEEACESAIKYCLEHLI